MTIQPKPGQFYYKIGTRMAPDNYITNADGECYPSFNSCLRAISNLKQDNLAPVMLMEPKPCIPDQGQIDRAWDSDMDEGRLQ